jgi:hypothetical protein
MPEITTTAAAPTNPTPAAPAVARQAEPTRHDGTPRPGVIADAQYDALPDDQKAGYSRVRKGPQGGSEWIERSKLEAEPVVNKTATTDTTATTLAPGEKYKFGSYEFTESEIADLMKFKGETELRRAAVPADPSQYKIELPKDLVMPAGVEWRFNEADPALAAARSWSHAQGLSQDQFSSLLGQYVSMEALKESTYRGAMKRELDALGANATMRVTALQTWLDGLVGPDIAKHMKAGMFSARIVEGYELMAKKFSSQGVASFRQDGREPGGQPGRVSEAEYDAMSVAERYTYSKGFDQKQFK